MRKLELHVNDMYWLVNELNRSESKYEMLIVGQKALIRQGHDPEFNRSLLKGFRKDLKKVQKIKKAMLEQKVYWR